MGQCSPVLHHLPPAAAVSDGPSSHQSLVTVARYAQLSAVSCNEQVWLQTQAGLLTRPFRGSYFHRQTFQNEECRETCVLHLARAGTFLAPFIPISSSPPRLLLISASSCCCITMIVMSVDEAVNFTTAVSIHIPRPTRHMRLVDIMWVWRQNWKSSKTRMPDASDVILIKVVNTPIE